MNTESQAHQFVNVASFNEMSSAENLKGYLNRKGVAARVQDESRMQKFWFAAKRKANIHAQVPKDSFERTEALLKEPEASPYLQNAIHCPSCKSLRIQYPDLTRKNILPTLLAQLFVLLGMTKHKYYCEDCHYSWLKTPLQNAATKKTQLMPATEARP